MVTDSNTPDNQLFINTLVLVSRIFSEIDLKNVTFDRYHLTLKWIKMTR